jgi:hypothetical protein
MDRRAGRPLGTRDQAIASREAAPRLPEQHEVAAVEPQCLTDLLNLIDEASEVPQRRLVGLITAERAKLVVVVVALDAAPQLAAHGRSVPIIQGRVD